MGRAEELFERLKEQGEAAIDQMILDRESESFFLDFKRSSNNGQGDKLPLPDRINLAKAISGFGNSEGGIIVWGVDCSQCREVADFADVARAKIPVSDPIRYKSWLEGAVSGCTIPPHTQIEHHAIEEKNGSGYVISYIPKSNSAPHQVITNGKGQYSYYIRAGSDFLPAPHAVLAGMFGRRPQPKIWQVYMVTTHRLLAGDPPGIQMENGIQIYNDGPGIAYDLFMEIKVESVPGQNCECKVQLSDPINWNNWQVLGYKFYAIGKNDHKLPPGFHFQPYVIHLKLFPPFTKPLEIVGRCGCAGAPYFDFEIKNQPDVIHELYNRFIEDPEGQKYQGGFWNPEEIDSQE